MARRRGSSAELERDQKRQRVQAERAQRAAIREQQRQEREALRQAAAYEREAKLRYSAARQAEADGLNEDLETRLESLENLLHATLEVDDFIDLEALKPRWRAPRFEPGALARAATPPTLTLPEAPRGLKGAFPGTKRKHEEAVASATAKHEELLADHQRREEERIAKLEAVKAVNDRENSSVVIARIPQPWWAG